MTINANIIFINDAFDKLKEVYSNISEEKKDELTDDIIEFLTKIEEKYK